MKKIKTWTVNTYQRRTNHALVAPDLLSKTEELSLEGMHFYLNSLAKVFEEFGYDTYYHNYELDITDKNGRNIIFCPMPATYEEVIE